MNTKRIKLSFALVVKASDWLRFQGAENLNGLTYKEISRRASEALNAPITASSIETLRQASGVNWQPSKTPQQSHTRPPQSQVEPDASDTRLDRIESQMSTLLSELGVDPRN